MHEKRKQKKPELRTIILIRSQYGVPQGKKMPTATKNTAKDTAMEKSTDDGAQRHDKFIQNYANFPKCAQRGYLFKCFQMRRENPPREQQQTAGRRNATAKTYLGGWGQERRSAPTQRSRRMQLRERAGPRTSPSQQTREEVNQLRWDRREGKRPTTKKAGHNPTTNKAGTKPTPTDGARTHTAA